MVIWIPPEYELDPVRDDGRRQRQRPHDHGRADHYPERAPTTWHVQTLPRGRVSVSVVATQPSGQGRGLPLGIADPDEASTDDYHVFVSSRRYPGASCEIKCPVFSTDRCGDG